MKGWLKTNHVYYFFILFYCGVHGTEHSSPARAYLTMYVAPEPEPKEEKVKVEEPTQLEKMKQHYIENQDIFKL